MDDTLSAGDPRTRDSFHQGWEKRILFSLMSPGKGNERRTGQGRVPRAPAAQAGRVEQSTHSSTLCGTAFRVYLEIILRFLLRGRGGQARARASGPGPPASSGPAPSCHLPAPSRPVSPRRLDSGPPPPRVPTL